MLKKSWSRWVSLYLQDFLGNLLDTWTNYFPPSQTFQQQNYFQYRFNYKFIISRYMLCNTKGDKRKDIDITEKQWTEMLNITFEGIKRKLNSARILVDYDKEISAKFLQDCTHLLWKNLENYYY
jgi:hypothetical protein